MKTKCNLTRETDINQRGAALVTVLFISLLLLTASVAMLTAVGANSRNTTDVLSETKAYYAAESGLQATVNVLRNKVEGDGTGVIYSEAVNDPDLSTWLPYNWPTSGTATHVVVGQTAASYTTATGTAYSINVTDPDGSAAHTTFTTVGSFAQSDTSLPYTATRVFGTSPDTTTVSFTGVTTTLNHPAPSGSIGSFVISQAGSGAAITSLRFRIDYQMTAPRAGVVSIRGTIAPAAAGAGTTASFDTQYYPKLGSQMKLCSDAGGTYTCADATSVAVSPGISRTVYAYVAPMEPYRLKVIATGYGPGALNTLEGIVQRNFFNGLGSGAATSMIGAPCPDPVNNPCFVPGNSNGVAYNGCATVQTQGCIPSFGATDPQNLAYIQANPPGGGAGNMTPPPALLDPNALPSWQQSPAALDALVDQLRTAAQHSGGYHYFPSGGNLSSLGNFSTGRGITFCEGSCSANADGGGILVVTGKLTNTGNFSFKGMIIITGEEGWLRNGGGNGQIIGNVVIAPYNMMNYVPENLSSTFLPPRYQITGGGGSDIIFGDVNASFDTTMGITDFVAGVAEK